MSWHFSQVLEAAYLAANCLDGEPSAPSSGIPTHGTFWSHGKTMAVLKPSRSGMTYKHSTENLGEDLLTWYLEDSRAKTLVPLEKAQESKESDHPCGNTWRESSVKFNLNTHSWRTHLCLWEEDLAPSSLILPKWGMMQSGALWERITFPLLTNETESGLLPNGVDSFHTPNTTGLDGGSNSRKALKKRQEMWPTPKAGNPGSRPNGKCGKILSEEILIAEGIRMRGQKFATPQARDWRSPAGNLDRWNNPDRSRNLNDQIGGQLNPTWVEWLMGWPLGWTDCAVSATDKYQQWRNLHGIH